jgi:cytochrome b6-f complex iron-sulfur subunit
MSSPDAIAPVKRRSILDFFLGAGLLGFVGSLIYPVIRYLKPMSAAGPGGPVKLSKEDQAKLEKEHSLILRMGNDRVLIFEDPQQKLRALNARCTHEGCTVQYVPGETLIWCACHNAKFDLDGRVLAGPPPRPLGRFQVLREADGAVTVAPEKGGQS